MKINLAPGVRGHTIAALASIVLLAGCVAEHAPPPPRAAPRPVTVSPPRQSTPVAVRQPTDWRDRPLTAGDWNYRALSGGSIARFGDGVAAFSIACDSSRRTVTLTRSLDSAPAGASVPATLVTTMGPHRISAALMTGSNPALVVAFAANDPTLDEMAFSRGRFAFEASGEPTLIMPSWEEVGRVIEDCR